MAASAAPRERNVWSETWGKSWTAAVGRSPHSDWAKLLRKFFPYLPILSSSSYLFFYCQSHFSGYILKDSNFVSLQLLPKFSWAGEYTGDAEVCITSWESTGVEGIWKGWNSCWKLFAVWFLGDSMTHCIFPCSLHLSTIYQLTHLIKTNKNLLEKL